MTGKTHKKSSTRFFVAIVVGLGATLASGLVFGRLTQRWGPPPDLIGAGQRVEAMPRSFGEWDALSDEPMSDEIVRMLECTGQVNRRYVSRRTGKSVSVAVIVGPPGPTSVHTPEICYSSRDFSIESSRKKIEITDAEMRTHTFWKVMFQSNKSQIGKLAAVYAWRSAENWQASHSPRFEFSSDQVLYKIQLAAFTDRADEVDQATYAAFLSALAETKWNKKLHEAGTRQAYGSTQ